MRTLIIGSGGREHALAWKIAQSHKVTKMFALPGNAGIGQIAERVPGSVTDVEGVADFAERERIDLVVIGPDAAVIAGMTDELERRGIRAFGPNKEAAQMEGSKVFAKSLMLDNGIPTGFYEGFDDADRADAYIESVSSRTSDPIVIKADGECLGKGVFINQTKEEALKAVDTIMRQKAFGKAGDRILIEEYLDGPETTFMCFVDGETYVPMVPSQDYKRAYDNDGGLNTGGMGCYAPVPAFPPDLEATVIETVVRPTLKALTKRGIRYQGVLYTGLALTSKGPKVIEFNARFGDPEAQVVMPLLASDLVDVCLAVAEGRLDSTSVSWYNKKALCVVMASGGYPGSYEKGKPISGLKEAEEAGAIVFHAGTEMSGGEIVTSGGRVLGVTAVGDDYQSCIDTAYAGVSRIHFEGAHYRHDIGKRLLSNGEYHVTLNSIQGPLCKQMDAETSSA